MVVKPNEENEEKILLSMYPPVPFPRLTTTSAVEYMLEKAKENVAAGQVKWMTNTITGEEMTLPDLEPFSRKVASALVKRGLGKGDFAIYLTSDVTRIFGVIAGVWRAGGVMYSSYPEDTTETLIMRIRESKAKFLFCDPISVPQARAASAQVDWPVETIVFGKAEGATSLDDILLDDGEACPARVPNAQLSDPILVLCTSGTTGQSKGAVYTNMSMIGFLMSFNGIPPTDKPALLLLRCTHVLGVLMPMRCVIGKNRAVMMHQVTRENIFNAVHNYKPFFAFGFPTFLMLLAVDPEASKYDRSSLQCVCTGGMVIPENFYNAMKLLPNITCVLNGFGLTECGVLTTTLDQTGERGSVDDFKAIQNHPKLTVGRLFPNTAIKVLDLETGKTLGPNQNGELCVKNPIMASGYLNRPEETAATFQNGWMKTGDLGYYDEDGWIFIVDRIKETFKYFNNHISPAEVEAELLRHPAVADAAVFGIVDPNGGDHIPRALVVLKPGATATTTEIREFADQKLAEYKKIRGGVYVVESLPRGKTGKVLRSAAAKIPIPNA